MKACMSRAGTAAKPKVWVLLSLALIFLAASSQAAGAKYLLLERGNGKVVYVPLAAVASTPEGNRYFTVIHDFFNPDLLGHLSRRHVEEIDCKGKRTRTRVHARFTGKRGTGKATLNTDEPTSWRPIRGKDDPMEIARSLLCPS
jgi:hypothetical protein